MYQYDVLSPLFLFIIDPSHIIPSKSEFSLVKETLGNHNNHICSYPNISSTCEEDIVALEELIDESFETPSCFSPLTYHIRQDIT